MGRGPAVLTEGFTGGAHCCRTPRLYYSSRRVSARSKSRLTPTEIKYALAFDDNGGFRPMLVGSKVLLRTEDDDSLTRGLLSPAPNAHSCSIPSTERSSPTSRVSTLVIRPEAVSLLRQATLYAKGEHSPSFSGIGPFGSLARGVADECALEEVRMAFEGSVALSRRLEN